MGAGVSTEGAPLSEVAIKNEISVLYDAEKKRAFDAAATESPDGTRMVPWPTIEEYAHDNDERALDPRKCMYVNLKAFKSAREQIAEIARVHIKGAVREIPWRAAGKELKPLGDDARQCGLDGEPAASLDALYEVAALAKERYDEIVKNACPGSVELKLAPLKGSDRAGAKARDEYAKNTAPCYSWLFDVVRGSALCETEADILSLYEALESNPDALHRSHTVYEYFRSFFLGNSDAVEKRLDMLCELPVDDANDVEELVDHVLQNFEDEAPYRANALYWGDDDRELTYDSDDELLDGLCELLESIQEYSGVVRVREAIFAEKEREFGAKSKEVGSVLRALGEAYGHQGEPAKQRDVYERALPIYEREYGSDSAKVAGLLNDLGLAYMGLGDYAKQRDVLERALAIEERAYGRDHPEVTTTLTNLGNAYCDLGDHAKARDLLERALAIDERAYGRDHPELASTLNNLGNAYGDLGDHAKKRDMLERALAIEERAYGRDHTQVAITLGNLGTAYGELGDHAKKRDMLERALAIEERTYGSDHIEIAPALYNLGQVHVALGAKAKAREYIARALAIAERAYGSDHPHTQMCRDYLAVLS